MRACGRLLSLALLGLATSSPAIAGDRLGLLDVVGPRALAEPLQQRLQEAARDGRLSGALIGDGLRQRLGTAPGVAAVLRHAEARLAEAERESTYMNQRAATRAASEVVRALADVGGRHLAPELVARAHGVLAVALLLKPQNPDRALREMTSALVASPRWQPAPDSLTPTAARLLERARQRLPAPAAPTAAELGRLAEQARLDTVVWLAVDAAGTRPELKTLVYERRTQRVREHSWLLTSGNTAAEAAQRAEGLCRSAVGVSPSPGLASGLASSSPGLGAGPSTTAAGTAVPGPTLPGRTPLYKRWWVWAIASTVLVGTVLAVTLTTTLREPTTEVRFRY